MTGPETATVMYRKAGKGAARVVIHLEAGSFCSVRVQRREHNCFLPGSFPRKSFPFRATQCYTESWKICGKSEMQQTCRNQRTGHPIEPSWDQVAVLSPMSSFPPGRDAPPPPNISFSLDPGEVGSGGPKLGCVGGGLGRVLSSGGKLWLGEVLVSVQPVNRSPLLLALTGSTRSGGTTVEPTDGLFRTPLRSVIIYGPSAGCAKAVA